jgi:hypothetical protein
LAPFRFRVSVLNSFWQEVSTIIVGRNRLEEEARQQVSDLIQVKGLLTQTVIVGSLCVAAIPAT